jgi:uncharacterized membrane protein YgdD (TMEM256/DUF423 family)
MSKIALVSGCIGGLIAVGLGAFGAHALKETLPADRLAIFETGVRYQMYHSILLLILGFIALQSAGNKMLSASIASAIIGILIFSGSLYILALTGEKKLGMITPFGGVAFLLSWALAAISLSRMASSSKK